MDLRITKLRAAMAALFVLAGIGLASILGPLVETTLATVGQTVNISDHSASAYFAKVDSVGKLAVGDGSGPLSVDGAVAARPAAPASPWSASKDINGVAVPGVPIAGPSSSPINLTSLSVSTDSPSGSGVFLFIYGTHVPSSATSCVGGVLDVTLWLIRDLPSSDPLSFEFPTPLQWKPPANTKACLSAYSGVAYSTRVNTVGFYGG